MPEMRQVFFDAIEKLKAWLSRPEGKSSDYSTVLLDLAKQAFEENPRLATQLVNQGLDRATPEQLVVLKQASQLVQQQGGAPLLSADKERAVMTQIEQAQKEVATSIPPVQRNEWLDRLMNKEESQQVTPKPAEPTHGPSDEPASSPE
ncbi:MAG: hypothetical protein HY939_01140 [Gammaproteobacteria bacterium]|nr:hypothetical protein [Gammaproteobacteria bacterium]